MNAAPEHDDQSVIEPYDEVVAERDALRAENQRLRMNARAAVAALRTDDD